MVNTDSFYGEKCSHDGVDEVRLKSSENIEVIGIVILRFVSYSSVRNLKVDIT
jgi:hypothetical protein